MAVVLAHPHDENLHDLHAWMKRHLAAFQLPSRWYVVDTIPRTSRGKVNRAAVAATCAALTPVDLGKDRARQGT
jgi:acyl-coenzyme A synthetase/AMP-(fatty) acid ligase